MARSAPRATLFDQAQAEATRAHHIRQDQLKKARATLCELEKDARAVKAAGITLNLDSSYLWDYAEKALRVSAGHYLYPHNEQLLQLLQSRGWRLVSRTNTTATWSTARLKRGRYRLIMVDLAPVGTAQPIAGAASA